MKIMETAEGSSQEMQMPLITEVVALAFDADVDVAIIASN